MSVRLIWLPMQAYRELLVTTPGLGQYISGAIMFEETLYQNTSTGSTMVDELNKQNIVPGVLLTLCVGPQVCSLRISLLRNMCRACHAPSPPKANINVQHPCRGKIFHAEMQKCILLDFWSRYWLLARLCALRCAVKQVFDSKCACCRN